jgi:hypothetical protein
MKLMFEQHQCFVMPEALYCILNTEITKVRVKPQVSTITLNFRDKTYSADNGGFHPVETRITKYNNNWQLNYVTDFAYHGCPYPELVKEIDICFDSKQVYHLYDGWLNKQVSEELIQLFLTNFIEYYKMGVYTVEVSAE